MAKDRFINNTLEEFEETNRNPIFGYEDSPILTLEEAVEPMISIVDRLMDYVATAKKKCNRRSDLLTRDESAAIYLYTMSTSFYLHLNETLRAENRHKLKPWFNFLKLFITALEKLPSTSDIVWRAVFGQVGSTFDDNDVHIWWSVNSCSINPRSIQAYLSNNGTLFAIHTINAKDITAFSAVQAEREVVLMPGTKLRAKSESLNFDDRLSVLHLEEINSQKNSQSERNYLFEQIRQQYQRNSRIERFMNPSKTFSIEQSYINLAIVNTKEQHEKERQLRDAQDNDTIMNEYERIYGPKTPIDIKDIFKTCKTEEKQVLVFGRAGIGKSTFSRYIAYQWAKGLLWQEYELLALIPLRHFTANRYPPNKEHSLIDLVKKEVLQYDLTEKEKLLLKKNFDAKKTLWILDGYDEIVQNVPSHLEFLFEQLLKTPYHIITSRPYLNNLSYDMQMEITGFTDENIPKYVEQFFEQMKDELPDASIKSQTLLNFLESNSPIWGLAHIPVNLELICSLWSNEDLSQVEHLTMTIIYTTMTEWLCRRYLASLNRQIQLLSSECIGQFCQKELTFIESLAFNAMQNNTIVIRPTLLKQALFEANICLQEHPHILNIGILKSFSNQGTGTHIETSKDYYFIHLSFQEYFVARYLINALQGSKIAIAVQFIKEHKYNQRYTSVLSFTAGLISESDATPSIEIFWESLLGEPLDLVGIRNMQLVISCIEEASRKHNFRQCTESIAAIGYLIKHHISMNTDIISSFLLQSLQKAQSLVYQPAISNIFIDLLQCNDSETKATTLSFISKLNLTNLPAALLTTVVDTLDDINDRVRWNACEALAQMGEKAVTNEVINKLVSAVEDENWQVSSNACEALGKMGEKAATNQVINKLVNALGNESEYVRSNACSALGKVGEKAATNEMISKLVSALENESEYVRSNACSALGKVGEKAATNQVINKLVSTLGDESEYVRWNACSALVQMGEKAATNEVISKLVSALGDRSEGMRWKACSALVQMGEKAATNEVISKLVSALGDKRVCVRWNACSALGEMGEKAATDEVISKLVSTLGDKNWQVRWNACSALGKMGEKAATNEVIGKLVSALGDRSVNVRSDACSALGKMGEKAATNEVINKLVSALGDESEDVSWNACEALGKVGEKAATNEVISKLVSALGDESEGVRWNACSVLGEMGEKAATNEVISKLVSALGDESEYVSWNACEALVKMGEKAATNEVISKLVSALGDENWQLRSNACSALVQMGEKAVTHEVINKLVSALEDENWQVRSNACSALREMGEKAATNEVVSKLVSALEDENWQVRSNTCSALGEMGKKAATNEVISKLVSGLEDENWQMRFNACSALVPMGEKAATNEVISKLVSALGDESEGVRWNACSALGEMGEKVATNEMISKLVSILGDDNWQVRWNACSALGKMGEKAATNEVISKLSNIIKEKASDKFVEAAEAMRGILSSSAVIAHLDPNVISDFALCKGATDCFRNILEHEVIQICFDSKNPSWLAAAARIMLIKRAAVTAVENKIIIYGSKEPIELCDPTGDFTRKLVEIFTVQRNKLYLCFDII